MLQPLEIQELSLRYAAQIAELRSFLNKASVPLLQADSLRQTADQLQADGSFRRDLALHLWACMEGGGGGGDLRSADLLGIVAVAAAGPHFAGEASTDAAHSLLRFVMEARRSWQADTSEPIPHPAAMVPHAAPEPVATEQLLPARHASRERIAYAATPQRKRLWLAGAVAALVAGAAGTWAYLAKETPVPHDSATATTTTTQVAPAASANLSPSLPREATGSRPDANVLPGAASGTYAPATGPHPHLERQAPLRSVPSRSTAIGPSAPASATGAPAAHPASTSPTPSSVPGLLAPTAASAPAIPPSHAGPAYARSVVPAGTLSRQLGSPTVPSYAPAGNEAELRRHPRLLRRQPLPAGSADEGNDLVAEADGSGAPAIPGSSGVRSSVHAPPVGTVRPASLGTMAANALYTPVPPYPSAAFAANVQGEVRVQARVDPSGNVASARVISGPPLLRDAALAAVQHWRYKPYLAGGKPSSASALAVVDFQLP